MFIIGFLIVYKRTTGVNELSCIRPYYAYNNGFDYLVYPNVYFEGIFYVFTLADALIVSYDVPRKPAATSKHGLDKFQCTDVRLIMYPVLFY